MDISNAITSIFSYIFTVANLLIQRATFTVFGNQTSIFELMIVGIILSMFISLFWKGAKG